MTNLRLKFKALGACALVCSLVAIWASIAQAESTGGSWTYETSGGVLKTFEGALVEPEVGVEVDVTRILHSEALEGTKILYECTALEAVAGSKLKTNGVLLGKLTFSGCVTFLNGIASKACTPKEGKVTTNLLKGQMLLHRLTDGTIDKVLVGEGETAEGKATNFATVESTASCSLGIKVPVGGKAALLVSNPTTHEVKHLMSGFSALTTLWILSNTPEHKSSFLGSEWVFLTGAHKGLKWAGLWL